MNERAKDNVNMGDEMIRGLEEMRDALRDGQKLQKRFTMRTVELELRPREFTAEQVQELRAMFRASQPIFAMLIGIPPATLRDWEQGRKSPPLWAGRLLGLMKSNPEPWKEMLENAAKSRTLA